MIPEEKVGKFMNLKIIPNCTYEGCKVNWNEKEKIWICPCCGSEFSTEGKVLKGPATIDLKKI